MNILYNNNQIYLTFFTASPPSGNLDSPSASEQSNSSQLLDGAYQGRQWPQYVLSLALILQTLGSSLLALAHSVVMLTVGTKCQHGTEVCAFLLIQDPSLSALAVIMLTAVAVLQVGPSVILKRLHSFDGSSCVNSPLPL